MAVEHVDVVLPAHNAARTVGAAVRSVQAQHRPPSRIIVVADACDDDTAAVARRAGADVHEVAYASAGAARNHGVHASSAPLVAFLDADDVWLPTWLEAVADAAARRPDASLYAGSFEERSPDDELLRRAPLFTDADLTFSALLLGNPVLTSAIVVRRQAFDRVGGFDGTLRHSQDWELWLKLTSTADGAAVEGRHLHYRRVPDSLTRAPAELRSIRDSSLAVIERATRMRPVSDELLRRARATVLKFSAMRCLLHDAIGPARLELRAALEAAPTDVELWGLGLLSATPLGTRQRIARLRQRARLLLDGAVAR